MDRTTAHGMIWPIRERIIRAILAGHKDVMANPAPGFVASLSNRSRYGCVFDRVKFQMILEFGETGDIRWAHADDNAQLEFLYIDGLPEGIALRPKKGDRFNTLTSNYPTDYEKTMRIEQEVMFGAKPPAHLFAAHTEDGNEVDPAIERILITCETFSNGRNHIDWWFEIYRSEGGQAIPFDTGYEQPRLPGTGFGWKIKPKRPAGEVEKPGRMKPTGSDRSSSAEKPDTGEGKKAGGESA